MDRGHRLVLAIFLVALVLRVFLCLKGGQFFFPDEARYLESRKAVAFIVEGKWRQGLALPFEAGDHVGFKVLGMAPAFLERMVTTADWVPGIFWSLFSAGSVLLIGLLARRLGGSGQVQWWSSLAAVTSATLFYYSRHLLPYDASMCFALAGLYVATGGGARWRPYVAGLWAGGAFAIYYGYWPLVGVVLVWGCLHGTVSWGTRIVRGVGAGLGALTVVGAAWAINAAWGNNQLFERARTFSETINQGDYRGSVTTWEFLLRAEGVWVLVAVALSALLLVRWRRLSSGAKAELAPGRWAVGAVVSIWLLFVLTGDVMNQFTVYGRLIRQMTPFLCLGLGAGAVVWLEGRPAIWRRILTGVLVVNAGWFMGQAWGMQFPGDFRKQWEPWVAARQQAAAEPDSYYRMVNVVRYIREVEELREPPLETMEATRHPLSFEPYLYELFGAAERDRRRAADFRMRVVKMPVKPASVVQGEPYGIITLKVRFQRGRPGVIEPLLSVGPYHGGELFFVHYLSDTRVRLGCEVFGQAVYFGDAMDIVPDQIYEIGCFSGSMLPPADDTSSVATAARQPGLKDQIWFTLDGQNLIRRLTPSPRRQSAQAYAGVNMVGTESVVADFSGEILSVVRGGFPPPLVPDSAVPAYGAIKLRLTPPIPTGGQPEPLVVLGKEGRAVLGFLLPLPDGQVRLGVEVWGVGVRLTGPLRLRGDDNDEVIFEFGTLFPPAGADEWGRVPPSVQAERKRDIVIRLNGCQVLQEAMPTPELGPTTMAVGKNPAGGSYVGEVYSGRILVAERIKSVEGEANSLR